MLGKSVREAQEKQIMFIVPTHAWWGADTIWRHARYGMNGQPSIFADEGELKNALRRCERKHLVQVKLAGRGWYQWKVYQSIFPF